MAGFRAAASARYPPTLVAGLLPHHCPATRVISSLHLPPAGYLCFTRPCIVRRRGCGPAAASSPRVPPLHTPAEESLGHFNDSRRTRQRHASPPAAVACALGTTCLLRVAVLVAPVSLSRLARRRSITKAAARGGDKLDPDQSKDPAEDSAEDDGFIEVIIKGVDRESPQTPVMLGTILLWKHTDSAKIHLVHHVFTAVLGPKKQLQLLERVYQLAFPEVWTLISSTIKNHKKSTQKPEVFSENWLSGDEKLEAGLAMAQIYMEMNKYKDAEQVLKRLSERITPSPMDERLDLLKDAVDLARSNGNTVTDMNRMIIKLLELIAKSKSLRSPPRVDNN